MRANLQQKPIVKPKATKKRVKQVIQTSQGLLTTIGDEGEELSSEAIALLNEPTPNYKIKTKKKNKPDTTHSVEDIKNILRQGITEKVGKLLSEARKERQLSLKQLAAKTGVKHPRVVQLERGENVEILTLARFAYALDYDLEITLQPHNKGKVLKLRME
jgi:ribosome-binding protein aMBF1 (putative translation factor)